MFVGDIVALNPGERVHETSAATVDIGVDIGTEVDIEVEVVSGGDSK
jgi:hypothetical protein